MAYPYYVSSAYPGVYAPTYPPAGQSFQPQPAVLPAMQNGIIWVSGDAEAMQYPVAPNNAVRLWHSTQPIVYYKSADASGKPSLESYNLVKREIGASDSPQEQNGKLDYATKDELGAVVGVVKGFDEVVSGIRADIETMKGDLYGVAGRQRAVKKQEAEDDT